MSLNIFLHFKTRIVSPGLPKNLAFSKTKSVGSNRSRNPLQTNETNKLPVEGWFVSRRKSFHTSQNSLSKNRKSASPDEIAEIQEELTPQPKIRKTRTKNLKLNPLASDPQEIEELSKRESNSEFNASPITVFGGDSSSPSNQLLSQVSALNDPEYHGFLNALKQYDLKNPINKRTNKRAVSGRHGGALTAFIKEVETILQEHVGNRAGGISSVLDLKNLKEVAPELSITDVEKARQDASRALYTQISSSWSEFEKHRKEKISQLKPETESSGVWTSSRSISNTSQPKQTYLEYEQPLSWDQYDSQFNTTPDIEAPLIIPTIRKTLPHKFVLVSIEPTATEEDIKKAVMEACENTKIEIVDIEIFTDVVANKQRRHAFVAVGSENELKAILDDRIRAFGVHINGQRSSILDVEEKNIISIVVRPPMDNARVEALLKELGIMDLVEKALHVSSEPVLTSNFHAAKPHKFSVFAPRDGNGELIGKAWITFPSHKAAYAAYHSLIQCKPGFIRAHWCQKTPNHFEEAIKIRDALAAENAELRLKLSTLTSKNDGPTTTTTNETSNETPKEEEMSLDYIMSLHIKKTLQAVRGDFAQAASVLNMPPRKLTTVIKNLKKQGHDIDVPEARGRTTLSSRD